MMTRKAFLSIIFATVMTLFFTGCASTGGGSVDPSMVKTLNDYPDHAFDVRSYIKGMVKGGANLLIWKDPGADFSKYKSVSVKPFGTRLLPEQTKFSYATFVDAFNRNFQSGVTLQKSSSPSALKLVGEVVHCSPGSRAARAWVGMGAGKAYGGVAVDIYEPGKDRPSMRIYTKDTASAGAFGGDSVAMLTHIFNQLGFRLASTLNTRIGR